MKFCGVSSREGLREVLREVLRETGTSFKSPENDHSLPRDGRPEASRLSRDDLVGAPQVKKRGCSCPEVQITWDDAALAVPPFQGQSCEATRAKEERNTKESARGPDYMGLFGSSDATF